VTLHSIDYGTTTIEYELIWARRKTLGITVHSDRRVTVRAPQGASLADVEDVVHKKGRWILRKQQEFEKYPAKRPSPRYASGETHLFLGRGCPLEVIEDSREGVKLAHERFYLRVRDTHDLARKEKIMREWYRRQARKEFAQRLEAVYPLAARYAIPYPEMKIRLMKKRWGSASQPAKINLNLRLIQTPQVCIDYVILHELAHLKELNHSKAFYALLDQLMPGWRMVREELNQFPVA